jgi:hypothetical protein
MKLAYGNAHITETPYIRLLTLQVGNVNVKCYTSNILNTLSRTKKR